MLRLFAASVISSLKAAAEVVAAPAMATRATAATAMGTEETAMATAATAMATAAMAMATAAMSGVCSEKFSPLSNQQRLSGGFQSQLAFCQNSKQSSRPRLMSVHAEYRDTRELFYSFHLDDVPAESVMHKCIVHFVPLNKKLPLRSEHPGFIVQKVYDTVERKLWKLTDKDYEDSKQHAIDLLVQKTVKRLGDLPDIEPEDAPADDADHSMSKRNLGKKRMHPIDVSRTDDAPPRSDYPTRSDTPGSCTQYRAILAKFKALTGDSYRDKWLDKLLQGIKAACSKVDASAEDERTGNGVSNHNTTGSNTEDAAVGSNSSGRICWPDDAVPAITALERATHETLASDFQKYNQKMRQLDFNLKNNVMLARRLLNNELDPVVILNMSPKELKDGLLAEEKTATEPEESKQLQMTDARCSRCMEKKVGIADIIQAGGQGDRYQVCT
ncbi:uncharacterized protein LOC103714040 [Phoenix dactylifera]|uniref:Uncharacterized protein LOC103714040 n=1 Tax=Phoenix dactylifera TaxID=42345 RepID=A0A8B8ZBW3_PHODC|nr:uncharacterized protein LOC103714040 [Phoenix dactylifera]